MITILGRANRRLDQQVQPRDESHRAAVIAADDADGTDGADAKSPFILAGTDPADIGEITRILIH